VPLLRSLYILCDVFPPVSLRYTDGYHSVASPNLPPNNGLLRIFVPGFSERLLQADNAKIAEMKKLLLTLSPEEKEALKSMM